MLLFEDFQLPVRLEVGQIGQEHHGEHPDDPQRHGDHDILDEKQRNADKNQQNTEEIQLLFKGLHGLCNFRQGVGFCGQGDAQQQPFLVPGLIAQFRIDENQTAVKADGHDKIEQEHRYPSISENAALHWARNSSCESPAAFASPASSRS